MPQQRQCKQKGTETERKQIGKGVFFEIPKELQRCVFRVGMCDRGKLHQQDLEEVEIQRKEKREKEKIAKKLSLKKTQKLLVSAIYLLINITRGHASKVSCVKLRRS